MNILLLLLAFPGIAQETARDWASLVGQRFTARRDVVYRSTPQGELKLDFYVPYGKEPGPTMLYIHGGGWQTGTKEQYVLWYLPYLQLGLRVVAVEYRLSGRAPAPAAVEDCRCAFLWVAKHGREFGVDPERIVITGGSAGGHLALMTAMLDDSFDKACGIDGPPPKAMAVVNYYGATDLIPGWREQKPHFLKFFREVADPEALAKRLSPLTWVRAGMAPVLTIHGDADEMVPYGHSARFHQALEKAGVANELVTIPGGAHGRHTWTDADTIRVQRHIEAFLAKQGAVSPTGEGK
ncbi:MAG: alpha/beta hydrolase [Bryobacterales bacterium]|nr:alpha/beta hydrolase [Bryobacterales bacterium]